MSTTFGIFIKDGKLAADVFSQELDCISEYDIEQQELLCVEVAFRGNSGSISWRNPLAPFLPPETKVFALDNTAQGIRTIKDILNETKQ